MKIYTVYIKPTDPKPMESAVFIKEGFSWYAAILHVFWTLFHKMWLVSAVIFAIELALTLLQNKGLVDNGIIEVLKFGMLLFIGAGFSDWYAAHLSRQGYVLYDVVSAANEDEAQYKFMSDMLQRSTFGSSQGLPKLV